MVCNEGGKDSGLCRIRHKHLHSRNHETVWEAGGKFQSLSLAQMLDLVVLV